MSISIQTNVDSLLAQQNLNIDNQFQSQTIQQLTSGYRINSSGDDAAGLAVANSLRSSVTELNQGVLNANNGLSQLQIVDGGLNNISTILDRLKTLATESASGTFTGSRATLDQEYQGLLTEVNRQAANINLNSGGIFNQNLNVYIGGATQQSNAFVNINLSGATNAVDATSLGLNNSTVAGGGGVGLTGNTQRIDAAGATFVKGVAGTNDQTFDFQVFANGTAQSVTATVAASTAGSSLSSVLSSLNSQLNQYGITAGTDNNGQLQFTSASAFTVKDAAATAGSSLLTNENTSKGADVFTPPTAGDTLILTNAAGSAQTVTFLGNETTAQALKEINAQANGLGINAVLNSQGTGINLVSTSAFTAKNSAAAGVYGSAAAGTQSSVAGGSAENTSNYVLDGNTTFVVPGAGGEALNFQTANGAVTVNLAAATTLAAAITAINKQTASLGVYAVENAAGTGISLQGASSFSLTDTSATAATGFYGANATVNPLNATAQVPATAATGNSTSALSSIDAAITALGLVQGGVGAGENKLNYAIDLAQSQISSFSAAESQIRDANVAEQAANLTKAQVLTQTSVAALAQANSEPQAILKLLQ